MQINFYKNCISIPNIIFQPTPCPSQEGNRGSRRLCLTFPSWEGQGVGDQKMLGSEDASVKN